MRIETLKNNNNIKFEAGLTKQIMSEINQCSIPAIENSFAAKNITTNFDNNKIVAWCAAKCMEIIETLNKKYRLNLGLPNAIFINNNLLSNQADMGMCLALPYLAKNTNKIYPETTIFFNSESKWENLDDIADEQYINNYNSTDLFINIILHEFIHAAHFKNLLAKLGTNKYSTKIINACNMQNNCVPYNISKQLGKYSSFNPLETIACDITKRICDTLDKTSLLPPFGIG